MKNGIDEMGGESMSQNGSNESSTATTKLSPRQERNLEKALAGQKYRVMNVVESIAKDNVLEIMDRMEMCTCPKCTCDVLALAMNSLPTKYVTTDAGKQFAKLDTYKRQFETDVDIALMKACMTVKEFPLHEEEAL